MTNLSVRLVSSVGQIMEDWERLLLKSDTATVFQTPAWVSSWSAQKMILGVYDDGLVGVGVFEVRDKQIIFGAIRPTLGDAYALADFGDIVAQRGREQEVWQQILQYLRIRYNASSIMLDFVREGSPSFGVLSKLGRVKEQEVSPCLDTPLSWEEYLQMLGRKRRHELKRKMKQIEVFRPEFLVEDSIGGKDIGQLVELVKVSAPEKRSFMTQAMEVFFGAMMREMFIEKLGKLFVVEIEGLAEAMVLGFEFKNRWYLYNGGYNPKIQSVGVVLSGMIIKEAITRKIEQVDFLRGNERYKYDLGAADKKLYNIEI